MLYTINELEGISDICYQMSKSLERKIEKKIWFTQEQRDQLNEMFELLRPAFDTMIENLNKHYYEVTLDKAQENEDAINKLRNKIRKVNYKMVRKGDLKIENGLIFMDILAGFEKIGDHIFRVTESIVIDSGDEQG